MSELCGKCRRAPASTATPEEIVRAVAAFDACYHEQVAGEHVRVTVFGFSGDTLEMIAFEPMPEAMPWRLAKMRAEVLRELFERVEPTAIRALREVIAKSERRGV
ncbi:MAG TPA: hypothetical protein VGK73_31460 [Polyangiaceae bacterium]